ncbi:hypothetical protein ACS0TY_003818 [Phlomoides rotata]
MLSKIGGSSGSTSSIESSMVRKPCKGHGIKVIVFTSYTEDNPRRKFMCCPLRETDDCKFFEWIGDDLPPQYKMIVVRVARKKNIIEAQLKEKKLRMIERKLGVIEEHNKELQNMNMELIRRLNGETLATKQYIFVWKWFK